MVIPNAESPIRVDMKADDDQPPLDRKDPLANARSFLSWEFATIAGERALHCYQGKFYRYNGVCYQPCDHEDIRARVYAFLDRAVVSHKTENEEWTAPFKPTKHDVDLVMDALKAATHLAARPVLPFWLGHAAELPVNQLLVCHNGLLHLPTTALFEPTPSFFATHALPVAYDPGATAPQRWLGFLSELWPNDPESIDTLQEWCGYLLTPDTRQQKIALLIGPKRSGKGTIARVLKALIGEDGFCGPTMASLSERFGLSALIGKSVAVVSDARLRRSNTAELAERLLSISGEDTLSIDRKYLSAWTGKLSVRFMVMSNELPNIADTSGALAGRFIVLSLTNSFSGKEDPNLSDTLIQELPGILNWAIVGWERLQDRGYFIQPKSAAELVEQLEELGSPMLSFIRGRCEIGPGYSVSVDSLFATWKEWCETNEHSHGDKQSFGRDLRAAVQGLQLTQPRINGKQMRTYQGIGLRWLGRKGLSDTR